VVYIRNTFNSQNKRILYQYFDIIKVMEFFQKHHIGFHVFAFAVTALTILATFFGGIFASSGLSPILSNILGQLGTTSFTSMDYTSSTADDGSFTGATGFNTPLSTTVDSVHHRLFVSDCVNNRVLVFNLDSSNIPLDMTADKVLGQPDFISSSSATTASRLNCPYGISYDSLHDRLFVTDQGNWRVLVFDTASITNGENAVNVLGQSDFVSAAMGLPSASTAQDPYGVYYNAGSDYLFVSQYTGSRVTVFDVNPSTITNNEDAVHVFGQPDFSSTNQNVTIDGLDRPYGVAYDENLQRVYIADTYNNRIMVYDASTMINATPLIGPDALYVIGQTDFFSEISGTNSHNFSGPAGIAVDKVNKLLYVADATNDRVLVFDVSADGTTDAINVLGQPDMATGSFGTTIAKLKNPVGIDIDDSGHLYVAETGNNRVVIYDNITAPTDGQDAASGLGHTTTAYSFDSTPVYTNMYEDGTPTSYVNPYGFINPGGVALDKTHHRLFVADGGNARVLVFNLATDNSINNYQADYVLGQSSFYTNTTGTTQSKFAGVAGVAYDSANEYLYVADSANHRVLAFDVRDAGSSIKTSCGTSTTGLSNGMNASCVLGQADFISSSQATTSTGLGTLEQLAVDTTNGRLFVTDAGHGRVMVFNTNALSNGMAASNVLGQADFTTTPTTGTQSKMVTVAGVAYDPDTEILYVSDSNNSSVNRVLTFDVNPATITNGENALHVLGQSNFTNYGTGTTSSLMNVASELAIDTANKILYVSDTNNHRILTFDVTSITDGEAAIGVIGQDDFTSMVSTIDQYSVNNAYGLYIDTTAQRLFSGTSDDSAHRVFQIDFAKIPAQTLVDGVVGSSYSQSITISGALGTAVLSLTSGTLPPGLTLGTTTLSGTPTTAGTYNFTVRAIDTLGVSTFYSNQRSFTITVTGSGGGGGGPSWCQDSSAINYGGSPPCVYANPDLCLNIPGVQVTLPSGMTADMNRNCFSSNLYCFDSHADNYGELLPCTYSDTPPAEICNDSSATNFNQPLPCTYTTTIPLCTSASATNFGGPLPCIFTPPPPPATCQDTTATNVGGALPCVYTPPPPPQLCSDATAENFGGPVPCTYVVTPPVETCATNPALCTTTTEPPPVVTTTGGGGCVVDAPPGADLSTIIVTQISGTFCQARNNVTETIGRIGEVYRSPFGDVISKTISATGLLVGTAVTLSTLLFANPLSFSEIVLIPQRLWSLLLIAFGLKKRIRPWGTVYDSVTKQPLDPAYVVLYDKDGNEVATSITDLDGRYGFIVGPGVYRMKAQKTNYTFPSLVLSRHTRDEIYLDLYFGNYFEIKDESTLIARNIPLDPEKFDWNEFVKREQKLMKFYSKRDRVLTRIADIFFGIGFTSSIIALLVSPVLYNVGIFVLYVILLVIKETGFRPKKLGSVIQKTSGDPLSYGVVHIFSKSLNTQLMTRILDKKGHYYALVPNGTYYVTIDQKNPDQTYTNVMTSEAFEVNEGVINRHFSV
jgi:DNA-binding beta-propeller fold protein YncE